MYCEVFQDALLILREDNIKRLAEKQNKMYRQLNDSTNGL